MNLDSKKLQIAVSNIVSDLDNIRNSDMKPVQIAIERDRLLISGVETVCESHGLNPSPLRSNSRWALMVAETEDAKGFRDSRCKPLGEDLAGLLSTVSTRTGVSASEREISPENGWLYIKGDQVESLLRSVSDGLGIKKDQKYKNDSSMSM